MTPGRAWGRREKPTLHPGLARDCDCEPRPPGCGRDPGQGPHLWGLLRLPAREQKQRQQLLPGPAPEGSHGRMRVAHAEKHLAQKASSPNVVGLSPVTCASHGSNSSRVLSTLYDNGFPSYEAPSQKTPQFTLPSAPRGRLYSLPVLH